MRGSALARQYSRTLNVMIAFSSARRGSRTSSCTFACAARWTITSAGGEAVPGPARERQVLQEITEVLRPVVHALVDAEDLVPVALQAQREVGADLAAGAGDD